MTRFTGMWMVLLLVVLSACAGTGGQDGEPINPGDKVGDFLITTGKSGEAIYPFDYTRRCMNQGQNNTFTCSLTVGEVVNITTGLYDDSAGISSTATDKLNTKWAAMNYQLFIDDRPVNLEAFGTIETETALQGLIRWWNVVVVSDKPGKITVRDAGTDDGNDFGDTAVFEMNAP